MTRTMTATARQGREHQRWHEGRRRREKELTDVRGGEVGGEALCRLEAGTLLWQGGRCSWWSRIERVAEEEREEGAEGRVGRAEEAARGSDVSSRGREGGAERAGRTLDRLH